MKNSNSISLGGIWKALGSLIVLTLVFGVGVAHARSDISPNQGQTFRALEKSRGLPERGISQSKVIAKYGQPQSQSGPVGSPPISTWKYPEFTVYFEHNLVITTVSESDSLPTKLKGIQ